MVQNAHRGPTLNKETQTNSAIKFWSYSRSEFSEEENEILWSQWNHEGTMKKKAYSIEYT